MISKIWSFEPWPCSTMKILQTKLLLRATNVLQQHWRKHFPIAVPSVEGFQLQASMKSSQTAILMRNRKYALINFYSLAWKFLPDVNSMIILFSPWFFRWWFQRLKAERWRDRSTSQASRETAFRGFTLLRQENCLSLRWWRHLRAKTSKMMKRKSFCRSKVVSHVARVLWAENSFILWGQTSRHVQASTNLISLGIGGAPLFWNFVIARDGHLVSAGKLCYYHPCPSPLLIHGCGVKSSRVQKMSEVI